MTRCLCSSFHPPLLAESFAYVLYLPQQAVVNRVDPPSQFEVIRPGPEGSFSWPCSINTPSGRLNRRPNPYLGRVSRAGSNRNASVLSKPMKVGRHLQNKSKKEGYTE